MYSEKDADLKDKQDIYALLVFQNSITFMQSASVSSLNFFSAFVYHISL